MNATTITTQSNLTQSNNNINNIEQFQRRFLRECHRNGQGALEVAVIWKGRLMQVDQYRKTQAISIGCSNDCTYAVENDTVGERFLMLDTTADGRWVLRLGTSWTGLVLIDPPPQAKRQYQISELIPAGLATSESQAVRLEMTGGTRAKLTFGDLTILIHQVTVHALRLPVQTRSMSGILIGLAVTLCAYLIFGGLVAYSTERSQNISAAFQDMDMSSKIVRYSPPAETKLTRIEDPDVVIDEIIPQNIDKTPTTNNKSTQTTANPSARPSQNANPSNGQSSTRPTGKERVRTIGIAKDTQKLMTIAKLGGGSESVSHLTQGFDGTDPDGAPGGLTASDAGCFGINCGGPGSINGGMNGVPGGPGVPGGKDGTRPTGPNLTEKPTTTPKATLTGGDVQTSGFDKQVIKRVINQKKAEITQCYNKELLKNPNLKGKITMKWRVLSSGNVGTVEVTSDEMGSSAVASCLKSRIGSWKFPAPRNGSSTDVSYPFNFSTR